MKALGLLKFVLFFFKMTFLGVPMWVIISALALVALVAVHWYRSVQEGLGGSVRW
jgi:hypothetical protein